MTKSDFVDRVASQSGLSKKDAGAAVDAVISSIEDALRSGEEVSFTGFGKFHVASRGAREGRNPRTGERASSDGRPVPARPASARRGVSAREHFGDRLAAAVAARESQVVLGIDP